MLSFFGNLNYIMVTNVMLIKVRKLFFGHVFTTNFILKKQITIGVLQHKGPLKKSSFNKIPILTRKKWRSDKFYMYNFGVKPPGYSMMWWNYTCWLILSTAWSIGPTSFCKMSICGLIIKFVCHILVFMVQVWTLVSFGSACTAISS